jgi:serine/threonine protein kinase
MGSTTTAILRGRPGGYPTYVSVGSDLDRYSVVTRLGSGGMATVLLAEDQVLGRQVALKRMIAATDVDGLLRLRREALIGASISHPNLVAIYDIVTSDDGDQVIVMEYVPGETLADALERDGALPPERALQILESLAGALDAIHRQGIVHRDVKPANVLLGPDGEVKLADLGIAAVADGTQITTTGALVGSFRYMAPEQLESGPSTPATDVYALSAVAFEILSGAKARSETNPVALAHAISTQPPPDLRQVWPGAPRDTAAVLRRGMSREPEARPRSAGELVAQLRQSLTRPVRPPRAARPRATTAPRRPTRALLPVLLALVAAAVALVAILSSGGSQPKHRGTTQTTHHAKAPARHTSSQRTPTAPTNTAPSTTASTPSSTTTPSTASTPAPPAATPAPPPGPGAGDPVSAVESFYRLAAAHQYAQAWALADPTFRNQLGGYQSFQSSQRDDRSITFNSAKLAGGPPSSPTLAVDTTSVRANGTQHCKGTVELSQSGAPPRLLLHLIHINCS